MRGYLWPTPRLGVWSRWNPHSLSFQLSPLHPLMRDLGRRVIVRQGVLPIWPKWVEWRGLPTQVRRDRAIGEPFDRNCWCSCSICQQLAAPRISSTNPETENTTVLKLCVAVRSGREEQQRSAVCGAHQVPSCNSSD